jgi:hypothetical protein
MVILDSVNTELSREKRMALLGEAVVRLVKLSTENDASEERVAVAEVLETHKDTGGAEMIDIMLATRKNRAGALRVLSEVGYETQGKRRWARYFPKGGAPQLPDGEGAEGEGLVLADGIEGGGGGVE